METQNKQTFLVKLKNSMLWYFNSKEIYNVLKDYNCFFESEESKQKGEAELCQEFGSPKEIASELYLSYLSKQKKHFKISRYMIYSILSFLLILFYYYYCYTKNITNYYYTSIVIIPLFIWYFLKGSCMIEIFSSNYKFKNHFLIIQSILFVSVFIQQSFQNLYYTAVKEVFPSNIQSLKINTIVTKSFTYFFIFYSLILMIYSTYQFYYGNMLMFSILIQGVGILNSSFLYLYFLQRIGDSIPNNIVFVCYPYILSLLLSVLYDIILLKILLKKKVQK